jgi:hypothetical protein
VEAGVSSIEWGVRTRSRRPGRQWREYYLADQEEARAEYSHLLENLENWDIELGYRTAEVKPGPFTVYRAPRSEPAQPEEDPEVLADILSLVGGVMIPAGVISTWTPAQRDMAARWAAAEHLHASDNEDVTRVPEPEFVKRAAEICASPAMAQLAVEAWVHRGDDPDLTTVRAVLELARDAITGLLVLLKDRQPS